MSRAAAAAASTVYVRGCTAAQAAAWWDGCAERCDTGRTKFEDVQSGGIHPEVRDGQAAQRALFHLQLVSFVACTSGSGRHRAAADADLPTCTISALQVS